MTISRETFENDYGGNLIFPEKSNKEILILRNRLNVFKYKMIRFTFENRELSLVCIKVVNKLHVYDGHDTLLI